VFLGINHPRRVIHRLSWTAKIRMTAVSEYQLPGPLRTPGLHPPLQAPELRAGGIEIGKLVRQPALKERFVHILQLRREDVLLEVA
jgi:hypothetical protein